MPGVDIVGMLALRDRTDGFLAPHSHPCRQATGWARTVHQIKHDGYRLQRSFAYDSLGRPFQATVTVSSTNYTFSAGYDTNSRLSSVTYPSGFVAGYTYTSLGYAQQVTGPGSQVYWTANARDAALRLTQQTAGNGVVTTHFDTRTDRLTSILAGSGNVIENFLLHL